MSKLKVSTKHNGALEKREKIIKIVGAFSGGLNPKGISLYTGINASTVKSIIGQLVSEGTIKKDSKLRGYYHLVDNPTHALFSYNLHNVVLTLYSKDIVVEDSINEEVLSGLIKANLQIGKTTHKATFHISTDYPFNFISLEIVAYLFLEKIGKYCNITPRFDEIKIATIEFNKDHKYERLENIECVTLGSLIAEFKLYQKKNCVREEFKIKVPIDISTVSNLLQQGITSTENNLRLNSCEGAIEELKEMAKVQKRMSGSIFRILSNSK
jgi:predicted transcriptional regulator